jgi:hypothetical protein
MVELAFWAVAAPLGAYLASNVDEAPALVAGGVVFLNGVRLFAPLKIGAALLLAPQVERLLAPPEDVSALKELILAASGSANGVDRSAEQRSALSVLLARLATANRTGQPARVNLRNSAWRLMYTDSTGNSSGKLGPFIGAVTQLFDGDCGYANVVTLGPLSVSLQASYKAQDDRTLAVQFESLGASLFGAELLSKPFPEPKPRGTWRMSFVDRDWRALTVPETGNVFVLVRDDEL